MGAVVVVVAAGAALAQGNMKKEAAAQPGAQVFHPRTVTDEAKVKKELETLVQSDEEAMKAHDLEKMAANVDFPVFMATDSATEGMGETWNHSHFVDTMKKSMAGMPKDIEVSHHWSYNVLSDNLALVNAENSMTKDGKVSTWRSSGLAIRKGGRWMWKSMMEGGWGDNLKATGIGGAGESAPKGY
jgi:hypothetical protein